MSNLRDFPLRIFSMTSARDSISITSEGMSFSSLSSMGISISAFFPFASTSFGVICPASDKAPKTSATHCWTSVEGGKSISRQTSSITPFPGSASSTGPCRATRLKRAATNSRLFSCTRRYAYNWGVRSSVMPDISPPVRPPSGSTTSKGCPESEERARRTISSRIIRNSSSITSLKSSMFPSCQRPAAPR